MKVKRLPVILVTVLIAVVIVMNLLSGFFADLWWFEAMRFEGTFWKNIVTEYTLWIAGFIVFFLFIWMNVRIPMKMESKAEPDPRFEKILESVGKVFRYVLYAGILVLAVIMAGVISSAWNESLHFTNMEGFGIADPVFGNDIGFYVFQLPFIEIVRGWLFGMLVLTIIAVTVLYVIKQGISFSYGHISMNVTVQRHLAVLFSLVFVLVAYGYYLDRYSVLYSTRSGSFYGAGYTDVNAQIPAYWIMCFVSLIVSFGIVYTMFRRKYKQLVFVVVGFIVCAIVVGAAYPMGVQSFIVNPTEQSKERPYIQNNIKYTRLAYEIERIAEKSVDPKFDLTFQDILADSITIKNVMLWDYRPLASTLDQLQVIRLYYDFPDVDIDRYKLPDGDYRQVMLSARELNQTKLPSNAQTWVNLNLVYTHGYGIAMSPVNVVTEEGLPEFFMKDIPPVSPAGLEIERPEIYFGEHTNTPVITNGAIEEFDYPVGDKNQFTRYKEKSGVLLGSFFKRLLFAMHFGDMNMLISQYVTPESRIHYHRNIFERVNKLAPWLEFDEDPYIVLANKRLYWIYDAYTTTDRYPYSMPYQGTLNYVRNSVKIVIDAYSGKTTFYKFNEQSDPFIRVYSKIYPGMFRNISEMPEELRSHIRYPQDLFDIQASIYEVYHMTDPQVFYNKEDLWNIANEKLNESVAKMESYYALIRLPGESKEEFIQMVPYTPNRRDNMIAWLCARSDGEHYGKMLVYKFPKQDLTYGPMQISARIEQDPDISQQLTLWNQQGSSVTRGNLLVIPVKNEQLYIQPVYLQATEGKLPELKRVIVSYSNRIAMEPTLDLALTRVFSVSTREAARIKSGGVQEIQPIAAVRSLNQVAREAMQRYTRAQEYLKDGKWAKYGEEIEALKKELEELVKLSSK